MFIVIKKRVGSWVLVVVLCAALGRSGGLRCCSVFRAFLRLATLLLIQALVIL